MIIVELVDNDTRERRYSDKNVMLRQIETGILYEDAVDVIPCKYTYEESDEPITPEPEPTQEPNIIGGIPGMMIPPTIIPNDNNETG
jgi:hypothetical protein